MYCSFRILQVGALSNLFIYLCIIFHFCESCFKDIRSCVHIYVFFLFILSFSTSLVKDNRLKLAHQNSAQAIVRFPRQLRVNFFLLKDELNHFYFVFCTDLCIPPKYTGYIASKSSQFLKITWFNCFPG